MRGWRRKTAALALTAVFGFGCATVYQPPSGTVWGYTGESATIPSLQSIFTHLPTKALCEASLAKDRVEMEKVVGWARFTLGPGCRELLLSPGSSFWLFSQSSAWGVMGVGVSTRDGCEMLRTALRQQGVSNMTTCGPAAARWLSP
jgi:hypothetical protein